MESFTPISSLIGGILIGLSVTVMLLFHGRVTGITGIMVGATFGRVAGDWLWRALFLAGLLAGGVVMGLVAPESLTALGSRRHGALLIAGLLVGFGTRLGNGCTSGHGVCGISRFSSRSMVATVSFMVTGMLTVLVIQRVMGGYSE